MALFPGQEGDERTVLFLRRHWLILVRHAFLIAFLAAIPFGVRFLLQHYAPDLLVDDGSLGFTLVQLAAYVFWMFVALFGFATWIDYYFDYWVVTDRRIVSIEQKGLFSRTVSQVHLSRVQDATAQSQGILATFLQYGNVYVQSAGEEERFVFAQVPNPNKVVITIMQEHEKHAGSTGATEAKPAAPKGFSDR